MDCLKLSFIVLLSFEFFCLVCSNSITSFFGKSDDKQEEDHKTTVNTASVAKTAAIATTTLGPGSSCGGLKGFLNLCDKTENTEPQKSVKTRSISEENSSDSDSDESKSDENSDETKSYDVAVGKTSNDSEPAEGEIEKRQVNDLNATETSDASEPKDTPDTTTPALPLGLKKRQVVDSDSSSESESVEEDSIRQRRDCRDGPGDEWKDCKK